MIQIKDKNDIPIKDLLYEIVTHPTKENFRYFVESTTGEEDKVDFKSEWIDREELSKLFLAMANNGGGVIIFGISESKEGDFEPVGIESFMDPADIQNMIEKYVPATLNYKTYNFSFDSPKYRKLRDKKFQMIIIEDTPEELPFISIGQGKDILSDTIYVRRGTKSTQANNVEIKKMLDRRMETMHCHISVDQLEEHMEQLEFLYKKLSSLRDRDQESDYENQREYIQEYRNFILKMIEKKKKGIERILD